MERPDVRILLATYDGEAYLREQMRSIGRQTFEGWSLVANDDGSSDGTGVILDEYRQRFPERIELVDGVPPWGSAKRNFGFLLNAFGDADYLFLSDQDDVWYPEKIEVLLGEIRRLEAAHGTGTPILVHSDLGLIGADGAQVHPSMNEAQNLQAGSRRDLRHLLVQNNVTGCSVVLNRALRDAALPVPDEAIMHDWWLALVAAAFGVIGYVPVPLVGYRQHGANSVGAKPYSWKTITEQSRNLREARQGLRATFLQASAFLERFEGELEPDARAAVWAYARLSQAGPLERRGIVVRHGFWKAGVARNVGMLTIL